MPTLIRPEDIAGICMLSEPEASPSGRRVLFHTSKADIRSDSYEGGLWVCNANGTEKRRLGNDTNAAWENDDTLLLSNSSGAQAPFSTVFLRMDVCTGRTKRAFRLPLQRVTAHFFGEGRWLIRHLIDLDAPDTASLSRAKRAKALEAYGKRRAQCVVGDELPFRIDGVGEVNKTRWTLSIYNEKQRSLTDISPRDFDVQYVCVDAMRGRVAFYGRTVKPFRYLDTALYAFDDRTSSLRCLLPQHQLEIGSLCFHGARLYFAALPDRTRFGQYREEQSVYAVDFSGGELERVFQPVGDIFGGDALNDCFAQSGVRMVSQQNGITYLATYGSGPALFHWQAKDGSRRISPEGYHVAAFSCVKNGCFLVAAPSGGLNELYTLSCPRGKMRRKSSFHERYLLQHAYSLPEPIRFINADGVSIEGFVLRPVGIETNAVCPAILQIHGGPHIAAPDAFFHELQVWAGMGCYVFCCNPRGSSGRGAAFADLGGPTGFGEKDYRDLMEFTDHVLRLYPGIDQTRLMVSGGSYGGFMTNWIIGQTHRFAAAISQRPIVNQVGFWYAADFGLFEIPWNVDGKPVFPMEGYWAHSPLHYAPRCTTPTLFLQSFEDYRTPVQESLQMYGALKLNGVDARICIFHGEGHNLSRRGRPSNRLRRFEEMELWIRKYLLS